MKSKARTTQLSLEAQRFVCRVAGNGFVVMNKHRQWTPVLNFAHPFDANLAAHLAKWSAGYTKETLLIHSDDSPSP